MRETQEQVKHTPIVPVVLWAEENEHGTKMSVCHVVNPEDRWAEDEKHSCVCEVQGETKEETRYRAEFIVRAVNCHDDLLEALRTAVDNDGDLFDREAAIAAIEKAEGR